MLHHSPYAMPIVLFFAGTALAYVVGLVMNALADQADARATDAAKQSFDACVAAMVEQDYQARERRLAPWRAA